MRHASTMLLLLLVAGCATPPPGAAPGNRPGAARLLPFDLGLESAARRLDNLSRRLAQLPSEGQRAKRALQLRPGIDRAIRCAARLPSTAARLGAKELARRPVAKPPLLPSLDAYARNLADHLAIVPTMLLGSHRPLGEPDDRRHRTAPADDRPEKTWWQRLRRRLRL